MKRRRFKWGSSGFHTGLFDVVVFLEVVGAAEELDVIGGVGGAAFGEGDDVVEV